MRKSESTRATRTEDPAMMRAGWWISWYMPSYFEKWFDSIPQASLSPTSSQFYNNFSYARQHHLLLIKYIEK